MSQLPLCPIAVAPCRVERVEIATGFVVNHESRVERADACYLDRIVRGVSARTIASTARRGARRVCAALAPGHLREGRQALDRSTASDASPLEAALLRLDTDLKLRRLSHGRGDTAVSRPTTRRLVVVEAVAQT